MAPNHEKLLSDAKNGSLDAMQSLNTVLFTTKSEPSIWKTYWPVLLRVIRSAKVPTDRPIADHDLLLPYHCLFGFMCKLRVQSRRRMPRHAFDTSILPPPSQIVAVTELLKEVQWASIWPWIVIFLQQFSATSISFTAPGCHIQVHEIITSFLCHLGFGAHRLPDLPKRLISSAGYNRIAMALWLRSIRDIDIALEHPCITYWMVSVITKLESAEMIGESLSSMPGAAVALLEAVKIAAKPSTIMSTELFTAMQIMGPWSLNIPALHEELLACGSIPVVTHMLARLTARKRPTAMFRQAFGQGLTYLRQFFVWPSEDWMKEDITSPHVSKPWMVQALEGRLLCSILKASHLLSCSCGLSTDPAPNPHSNDSRASGVMVDIIRTLRCFVSDERILRAIRTEFRRIDADRLNIIYAAKDGKPCQVWDNWVDFERLARFTLRARDQFHEEPHQICSNSSCRSPKQLSAACKRCGGCHLTFYCSKVCQKEHWNDGHREMCRKNPLVYPGVPKLQSQIDKKFYLWFKYSGVRAGIV
ncbi:hypothetical protein C8J56DRAFT_154753 [Mycena floridula]|nr:hypothetical protein C8J56DRAFT_154753 [Mycena floridula]